jgi:hypothetical protein
MTVKTRAFVGVAFYVVWYSFAIGLTYKGSYEYAVSIGAHWEMADRSSTIQAKSAHLDKFVEALERQGLDGACNALFLCKPEDSFDQNLLAVKTLQARLHEIAQMNVASFEYQIAIQQITEQEQGEARAMTSTFEDIWWKQNYYPLGGLFFLVTLELPLVVTFIYWLVRGKP